MTVPPTTFEYRFYDGLRGEAFQIATTAEPIELVIEEVTPKAEFRGKIPFSVFFQSNSPHVLPQAIYRLTHATAGAVDLFIIPRERRPEGIVYQAVFN